ncbi:MAG: Ig-like domain-containing protein [Polyangiaceae bacterium]
MFAAAYTTFNPAAPDQNFIADIGSPTTSGYRTMSFSVANGSSFDVVVTQLNMAAPLYYEIDVSGCTPQVSASVVTSPDPSVFGEVVTLQATVTASGLTPTGTVNFMDGATLLGTATLDATGTAFLTTTALAIGARSITTVYSGDGSYPSATSAVTTHTVNAASTSTIVASSQNPQSTGQAVTFTATVTADPPGSGTPSGTVTFTDGATSLGTVTLSGGQASLTTSSLTVGGHTITAVYSGSAEFNSSVATMTQVIDPGAAVVTVVGTPSTTNFGQAVTFVATVTAMTGSTPTGTVTFKDGTNVLVTVALDGTGVGAFITTSLDVGTHTIVADYNGDVNHNASSGSTPHTVNQAPSTTILASIVNPSVYGQTASFTGTVTGSAGVPTGLVTIFDGASMIGSATLDAGGTATFTSAVLTVGTHPLTLVYAGDTIYAGSTSAVTNHVVNKGNTVVLLASSQNPQGVGATITFTATISVGPPGAGAASGDVSFFDNTNTRVRIGGATIANGQATLDVSTLSVGLHAITADYAGDTNFNAGSSASVFQQIDPLVSSIALTTAPDPSTFGQSVVLTAQVAPGTGGTATGNIAFSEGGNALGTVTLDGSGSANLSLNNLTVGTHTISAAYSGDNNHNAATASVSHVVNGAATTTVMTSSANPSVFGQTVRLTATVASTAGVPSGTIAFRQGTTTYGTVTLDNAGVAFIDLNDLSVGSHSITAAYSGAANFAPSSTAEPLQVVNKAATSIAVTSSSNPIIVGTNVTFTATLSVTTPGAGTPSGNVEFRDGTTALGSVALSGGTASYTTSALAIGDHAITAVYAGDDSFVTSTSASLTQTVSTIGATLAVSVSPNPTVYGQNATVTAIAAATNGGTPTGTVTFTEGTTTLGTGTLANGSANFVVGTLGVGTHSITATYGGDANHPAGANATAQLTVAKRATRTTLASSVNPTTQGQATTLTATIVITDLGTDAGGPSSGLVPLSGTVTFKSGQTTLGTGTLSGGMATLSVSTLTVGSHSLTASYEGAANYDESASAALVQVVNQIEAGVPDAMPPPDVRDAGPDVSVPDARLPDVVTPPPDVVVDVRSPDATPDTPVSDVVATDVARDTMADAADAAIDIRIDVGDAAFDGSIPPSNEDVDDSCSCRLASRSSSLGGLYTLGLAVGAALLRRRRRSKSTSL